MQTVRKNDSALLPGVRGPEAVPSAGRWKGFDEVRRARRRALMRDVSDLLLLLAIDMIFVVWPAARLPFITRRDTLDLLVLAHLAFVFFIVWARYFPKWQARRIATTWCRNEQQRLVR